MLLDLGRDQDDEQRGAGDARGDADDPYEEESVFIPNSRRDAATPAAAAASASHPARTLAASSAGVAVASPSTGSGEAAPHTFASGRTDTHTRTAQPSRCVRLHHEPMLVAMSVA